MSFTLITCVKYFDNKVFLETCFLEILKCVENEVKLANLPIYQCQIIEIQLFIKD